MPALPLPFLQTAGDRRPPGAQRLPQILMGRQAVHRPARGGPAVRRHIGGVKETGAGLVFFSSRPIVSLPLRLAAPRTALRTAGEPLPKAEPEAEYRGRKSAA